MITAAQQRIIDEITQILDCVEGVEAVWLAGSLGIGRGDAFSDVDLLVLTAGEALADVSRAVARNIADMVDPAYSGSLHGGRVLNFVTDDWTRFDLALVQHADLSRYDAGSLIELFNKTGSRPSSPPAAPYKTSPEQLLALVTEFLRILGLAPVAVGREEYELALTGIDHLRRMTFELMLEENGVAPSMRGGALRRNPMLSAEQRAELATLPPLVAERSSIIAGEAAFARIFLPRARRLAASIGAPWPTRLEEATRRHLRRSLEMRI